MKILVVGPDSIHVSSFLKYMDQDILYVAESKVDFYPQAKQVQVSFRSWNPLRIFKANLKLKKVISQFKPDVIHIHQINRAAFFVAKMSNTLNIPCISTAWGSDILLVPKQNFFFKYLVRKSIQWSRFVTADSHDMIEALKSLDSQNTDRYIHLQYGIDDIPIRTKEKIVYSNRLHEPNYRIEQVIHFFKEFKSLKPNWRLIIAGSGSLSPDLKTMTVEDGLSDSVEFIGWLSPEDNKKFYSRASIFISIPKSDGSSVSLLEAISAECIPVISNLQVSKEWVEDGKNGIIEKSNANPLIEALALLDSNALSENSLKVKEIAGRSRSILEFKRLYSACLK